jgi:hypothetical protein
MANPYTPAAIYNNGLGQALPLNLVSGNLTAYTSDDSTFRPGARTYYQVSYDGMIADFNTSTYATPLSFNASDEVTTQITTLLNSAITTFNT